MNSYKKLCLIFLLFWLGCGSEKTASKLPDDGGLAPNISSLGTPVNLTFRFSNQVDSSNDALDFNITYPDDYTVPIYIQNNGIVTMLAKEFPRMVLRICPENSTVQGCDIPLGNDIQVENIQVEDSFDIVLDACGKTGDNPPKADSECGNKDGSVYSGSILDDGSLTLNNIVIRARVFVVKSNSDGFRASNSDSGLIPLDRIQTRVTTGVVTANALSAAGSKISNRSVTLVAGGFLPASIPELGGASYTATLTGEFDVDPLGLLD